MKNMKFDLLFSNPGLFLRKATRRVANHLLVLLSPAARRHSEVGPAVGWKETREVQLEYLKKFIRPEHYLLDLGCGTLRGGIPIIRFLQEGHYYGIEVRDNVLEIARKELQNEKLEHKNPKLIHVSDLSKGKIGRKFDFIWAHSVLIHMTDEILDSCLCFASEHLDSLGRLYANVNIGERKDSTWKEFPIAFRSLQFYSEVASRHDLNCEEVGPWRNGEQTMLLFQLHGRG